MRPATEECTCHGSAVTSSDWIWFPPMVSSSMSPSSPLMFGAWSCRTECVAFKTSRPQEPLLLQLTAETFRNTLETGPMPGMPRGGLIYDTINIINPRLHSNTTCRHGIATSNVHQSNRFFMPPIPQLCGWRYLHFTAPNKQLRLDDANISSF